MSNTSNTMLQQHIDILQNTLIHRVMTSSNLFPDRKEIEGEFSLLQSKLRMYVYWIDQNDMHESRLALGDALDTIETIRDALAETN